MIEFLKKRNRTVLELWTGMTLVGIICEIFVLIFSQSKGMASASLWLGVVLGFASSIHMYKSLDRALDFPEAAAKKKIVFSYSIRYAVVIAVFAIICITDFFNPLLVFLGYMTLKIGALIQPQTHKLYVMLFHEKETI
ncbi:MAG: ATP synthase subunit I [Lachnospiraceae bacterium]|nr:ATP synthase subunit I [Lachnospiraceae bacterium]